MNYFINKIECIKVSWGNLVDKNHILTLAKVKYWKNLIL